jgi:hypothetical protein
MRNAVILMETSLKEVNCIEYNLDYGISSSVISTSEGEVSVPSSYNSDF